MTNFFVSRFENIMKNILKKPDPEACSLI